MSSWRPPAEPYAAETELLAPFPWGEGVYTAWLFCQIDLHNGEIQKYNQSLSLLAAAWRSLADWLNRQRRAQGPGAGRSERRERHAEFPHLAPRPSAAW